MKLKELVKQMTLEEKAGLCSGKNFWETKPVERLGVPSIMMTDGPHGLRIVTPESPHADKKTATCFPPAVLSACSFDRELLRKMGEAIAAEAAAEDTHIVLGPGVNMKRSPLCGRNFEYFSEDPYLAGEMAVAFINGVQSKGVGTSLKHYAANNQETRRWSSDSQIDERTLREIYLPAFEKAVKETQPTTVMCSYNRLNGEYVSESRRLLTEILRGEWGFEGVVVSDWGAVNDRVKGLEAGLELEMPGVAEPSNDRLIVEAVKSGKLDETVLDLAAERILHLICRIGGDKEFGAKFECDGTCCAKSALKGKVNKEKHDALSRRIAAESMVLLKNDGNLLPLKAKAKVAFIGELASIPRYQGNGSSHVTAYKITSALEAAQGAANVTYAQGYKTGNCDSVNKTLQAKAVAAAKAADVCVVFVGLPPLYESEGFDRTHMRMPEGMNKLVQAVLEANKNTVVVLSNGSPVEMPWADDVPAILESYLGGQAGGAAVADILFGAANPCGKLAESMPYKLSDNPSYLNYFGERDVTQYREGIFIGYRYYDAKEMDVLFPFGHGLSYTKFKYSNLKLSKTKMKDTDTLTVTADIENVGKVAGKEIVQLYVGVREKDDRLIRADRELRDFVKISLAPGEKKTVKFKLGKSAFSYYNTEINDWHVLTGDYVISVAKSSRDIPLSAVVHVRSTVKIPFRATPNTTVRDIKRMEHGREFLRDVVRKFPDTVSLQEQMVDFNDPRYMWFLGADEQVLRQMRLMGSFKGTTTDDIQKWMDEKLNRE